MLIWFMCDVAWVRSKIHVMLATADGQRPHRRYLDSDKSDSNGKGGLVWNGNARRN